MYHVLSALSRSNSNTYRNSMVVMVPMISSPEDHSVRSVTHWHIVTNTLSTIMCRNFYDAPVSPTVVVNVVSWYILLNVMAFPNDLSMGLGCSAG